MKVNQYDTDGHLMGMDVWDWVVTKSGQVRQITDDNMHNLHYTEIARFATQDEIFEATKLPFVLRAWDDINNEMVYQKTDAFEGVSNYVILRRFEIVMLSLGIKDRNGKDIFVGDVLRSGMTGAIYIVRFGEYKTKTSNGLGFWKQGVNVNDRGWFEDSDSLNVIGNIYENPELKNAD